jgi:hypothetical protein
MKLTAFIPIIASFASTAYAEGQSAPFNLQIVSDNPAYNATYLSWIRAGPYYMRLVFSNVTYGVDFYLNSTQSPGYGILGVDQKFISTPNFTVPLSLRVSSNLDTNVASTLMDNSKGTDKVDFDDKGLMYLRAGFDDSIMPNATLMVKNGSHNLYRWVACNDLGPYGGVIDTLAWVVGGKPQNPTCVDVSLKRVWVKR